MASAAIITNKYTSHFEQSRESRNRGLAGQIVQPSRIHQALAKGANFGNSFRFLSSADKKNVRIRPCYQLQDEFAVGCLWPFFEL